MTPDSDGSALAPDFVVRLSYAFYLFVGLLATMLFTGGMQSFLNKFSFLKVGCELVDSEVLRTACAGEMMAYRVSFALAVFFFIHWLSVSDLTCCVQSRARAVMQTSFFSVKSFLLGLLFFLTFFIPNGFFAAYAYVCLFASAVFLLMNVVFLVDFSYQWSDDWGERADSNGKWMWYLLLVAVGSFLLAIGVSVASFILFVPHADCNYNAFAVTSVLVGALLYTVLSVWVPHGSVVPSGIVFLYTSCIMFVTLRTSQNDRCNRLGALEGRTHSFLQMLIGSLAASFMLAYTVITSGGSGASLNVGEDDDGEEEDPDRSGHLSHYMFFYFVMVMGSMYLAMLATGWHVSGAGEGTFLGSINVAFWVRSSTVWAAVVLYVWSLVAPYTCCKGRDFGFAVDDDWI